MRVATVDGLVTLFYDGSKELFDRELNDEWWKEFRDQGRHDDDNDEIDNWEEWNLSVQCKKYFRERLSWQQIIIIEGVTEIPEWTFAICWNINRVIFANTVLRIKGNAFLRCRSLVYVKLSINLEYIGSTAFYGCNLYSIFVPPTCREICAYAFYLNKSLSILNVPQHVELGGWIIQYTLLAKTSHLDVTTDGWYGQELDDDMNTWIKNMNHDETFSLHREFASLQPSKQVVYNIIQQKGLKAFKVKNSAGIAPSQYLYKNPYTELTEKEIIHDYLMKMMGECG
ncbi:hypothetical protein CTEN210_18365 [Chaetoceros tenuissimus]|uniref:Leucine-rich repeat domain-containing protein n=1 Tax=Chaetoceros tenuissimus TaxID=426638 RepID=A0AAD3DFV9_9STRA|nr:hypothetical protein CTEN210_18365 [Chaetoceros tenuissimus]